MSYSYCILSKKNINACRIPTVTTTKGHYFASWKDQIWRGNINIMSCDDQLVVELRNYDETLYAKAKISEDFSESVQKAVDSSRGYALRLTSDDGRSMWVGLKFHDRNDAFDFHEAFVIHKNQKQKALQAKMSQNQNCDMSAFQLKPGQKIQIGGFSNNQNSFQGGGLFDNPFGQNNGGNGGLNTQATGIQNDNGFGAFSIQGPDADNGNSQNTNIWGNNSGQTVQKFDLLNDNFFGGNQNQNNNQNNGNTDLLGGGSNPTPQNNGGQGTQAGPTGEINLLGGSNSQPQSNNTNLMGGFGNINPQGNPFANNQGGGNNVDLLG